MTDIIRNIPEAATRIREAVVAGETIILYGDADLDGVSSVVILKEAIQTVGGQVAQVYFPNLEVEKRGLNDVALEHVAPLAPGLLVVMDCGITNVEEVAAARQLGFFVIVIDHHEPLDAMPEADIIVDPKHPDDPYPFKELATAGLAYKLAEELLQDKFVGAIKKGALELAALGTTVDMMPKEADNEQLIDEGTHELQTTFRPGLHVLLNTPQVQEHMPDIYTAASKVMAILSAGLTLEDHSHQMYEILTAATEEAAAETAELLLENLRAKRERIREIVQEVENRIKIKGKETIVFEADEFWEVPFLGSAASRLVNEHEKPIFLCQVRQDVCQGSVRSDHDLGLSMVDAMSACKKHLTRFGGHPMAAGFTCKAEELDDFKTCLIDYVTKKANNE